MGKAVPRDAWMQLLAHENLHTWISREIGGFDGKDDDLEAWLNEGFTEAYTARILLQAGLWSSKDCIAGWNASLARYGTSPVKMAPNTRIFADRQQAFDVNKLPYDRGRLLALLRDKDFKAHHQGKVGLYEVMIEQMRQVHAKTRRNKPVGADRLFLIVMKQLTGIDLSADLVRYVDRGEAARAAPRDVRPLRPRVRNHSAHLRSGFQFRGYPQGAWSVDGT